VFFAQPCATQLRAIVTACVQVKIACNAVPAQYATIIFAAFLKFIKFVLGIISTSDPSSSCLGAIFFGLYTRILVDFLIKLTGCHIIDIINALQNGGVIAVWGLCGGLPDGMNSTETAFCDALALFYTALAKALGAGCLPSLISAILVALNTLLTAILALVAAISTCTVCNLTSVLIAAINALVAAFVKAFGLLT
jgi:hypothetical protein